MEELIKLREETLKKQKEAEQVRKKRDEMIAARVAAARARQRARAGLPPEEPPKGETNRIFFIMYRQRHDEVSSLESVTP